MEAEKDLIFYRREKNVLLFNLATKKNINTICIMVYHVLIHDTICHVSFELMNRRN